MGRSIPQALFEVGRRGPLELRPAFDAAHREWLISTDFERTLTVLKGRLADPTADATCETLLIAHELGGSDLERRLEALIDDRVLDTQGRKDARAKQAGVRFARRFVLLVPLGMAFAGMSVGTGRAAYQTVEGQTLVVVGVAMVVACWMWAGPADEAARRRAGVLRVRLVLLAAVALWIGAALLLSQVRWFARRPLVDRLRPYAPGGDQGSARAGLLSVESFRDVIAPLASEIGGRVASLFGVDEDLATRLERVHSPLDATDFRVRQLGVASAALAVGSLAALGLRMPPAFGLLCVFGLPLLAFLVIEQQLASESARWQSGIFLELPVVSEQLGMLLSAGYSLGAALNRLAVRGKGNCGRDLARVWSHPARLERGRGASRVGGARTGGCARPARWRSFG